MPATSRKTLRLIKRYESGERSPELIQALNEAAWDGFHDPWEPPPAGKEVVVKEGGAAMDPETIQPFTLDTIERLLKRKEISYWRSDQKTCLVFLGYDQDSDRCLRSSHAIEGKNESIYCLRVVGDRRVDAKDYGRARELCDQWNGSYRWPRAYLEIPTLADGAGVPASGLLVLDYQLDLEKGIHQSLFDDLVEGAVFASFSFWKMAKEEFGL